MSTTQEQYEAMRKAFQDNISAIRSLLDQADDLNQIATSLDDTDAKERLSKSIQELYKNIDSLIKHTNFLFDQLVKYARTSSTIS